MSDVIYENPAAPFPENVIYAFKLPDGMVACSDCKPDLMADDWRDRYGRNLVIATGYKEAIPGPWRDSLRRIIRLSDPAYYCAANPHTDDEGFLPHDGGPMPKWLPPSRDHVEVLTRGGRIRPNNALNLWSWRTGYRSAEMPEPENDVVAYRIVGEGSEGREAGDTHIDRKIRDMGRLYGKQSRNYYIGALEGAYREVEAIEQALGVTLPPAQPVRSVGRHARPGDRLMRAYIRVAPFPVCKHCGVTMDYYVIGLPDEDHAHPGCAGKAAADAALAEMAEVFGRRD